MDTVEINNKIGEIWDQKQQEQKIAARKQSWWQFEQVYAHIGRKINGSFINFIRAQTDSRQFKRGISVGCGSAVKEMRLLQAGVVEHFDLYELSQARINDGMRRASELGLQDRATFHLGDAFAVCQDESSFDLVHWDNSLHHMMDVFDALTWSRHVLSKGGALVMDDFVGPSRFQWSDQNLDLIASFRSLLPRRLLRRDNVDSLIPVRPARPTIPKMIEADPSEAADSERILPALREVFPGANVIPTGGAIYHLGLGGGVYKNLDVSQEEDARILEFALLLDDVAIKLGETHYAVCVAFK